MPKDDIAEAQKRTREMNQATSALQALNGLAAKFNGEARHSTNVAEALKAAADVIRTQQQRNRELEQELEALKKQANAKDYFSMENFLNVVTSRIATKGQVMAFIDRGADINQKDRDGFTPLMKAGNVEILNLLIRHGADLHAKNKFGQTALDIARKNAQDLNPEFARFHGHFVKVLKEAEARQQPKANDNQASAKPADEKPVKGLLLEAVNRFDPTLVKSVIARGADLNESNEYGYTPLIRAVGNGYVEIARILIENGANLELKDALGRTALEMAKIQRNPALIKMLEEAAKPSVPQQLQGKPLTVLIDGSGSMTSPDKNPPLQRSLDATLALSKAGVNVSAVFWGDSRPVSVPVTEEDFAKAAKVFGATGTEFLPAISYMQEKAAEQAQHFVIMSDGDLYPTKGTLLEALKLLSADSKTTLDFVLMTHRKGTEMDRLVASLAAEYPRQVSVRQVTETEDVAAVLKQIAIKRDVIKQKHAQYAQTVLKPRWGN